MPADTPAALAALTELSELQALLDAYVGAECRNAYIRGIDSTSSWHEEDEADVKTPRLALMTKLSALLAAARQGEEDTTLTAVRAWFDAWADWPTTMSRDEAARLPEWDAMIDALGYDRDERRSAARAASQPEEGSRG